jgi:nitroreductase
MELREALRTTGAVRDFTTDEVPLSVVYEILDDARFAPSGGNRQAWHVIVVTDEGPRRALRDAYLDGWHDYVAHLLAGLIPFSPLASEADRITASLQREAAIAISKPESFPERLDQAPVLLVITADLAVLAAVDRDLDRYQIAGGASIYPFAWQILLAARERGLAGVMTTIATRNEDQVRQALRIPPDHAVAAVMALGTPLQLHTKLKRRPVEEFATINSFDGPALRQS